MLGPVREKISRPTKRVLTLNRDAISSPLPSAENPRRKILEQRRDQAIVFTSRRDRLQAENRSARAPRGAGRIAARRYVRRSGPLLSARSGGVFCCSPGCCPDKRCPARCRAGRPGSRGRAPRVLRSRPEARGPPEGTERMFALTTDGGADISVRKGGAPFRSERRRLICLVFTNCRVFRGDEFQVVKKLGSFAPTKVSAMRGNAGFVCSPGFISVRARDGKGSGGEDLGYFAPGRSGDRRFPAAHFICRW